MGRLLDNELSDAGYKMLGDNKDIYNLIAKIIIESDIRYLKAIPFLIYKHNLDFKKLTTNRFIKRIKSEKLLITIIQITSKIFYEFNIDKEFYPPFEFNSKEENELIKKFKLNYNEFKQEFQSQLDKNESDLIIDKQKIYAERELQFSLSKIFTLKEKQIITNILNNKPISKTDYEYYSRKTKKKLMSIIYLEEFSKSIINKSPDINQEIYDLKKYLENFIEKKLNKKGIELIEFFQWNNELGIRYKDIYFGQDFIKIQEDKINNQKMKYLLKKYTEYKY